MTATAASSSTVPDAPSNAVETYDRMSFRPRRKRARVTVAAAALLGGTLWLGLHARSASKLSLRAANTSADIQVTPSPDPARLPPSTGEAVPRLETQLNTSPVEAPPPHHADAPSANAPTHPPRKAPSAATMPRSVPAAALAREHPIETELPDPGTLLTSPGKSTVDEAVLQQSLAQAAERAKGCHIEGGPTGTVRVSVTFAPSGDVTGAAVQGAAFTNTVEGECIAAKFRALHIPAFTGNEFVARKAVTIE